MSRPNLTTLPTELHLKIGFYLRNVDSIAISLTCKKLHAAYPCHLQFRFPAKSFWKMISVDCVNDSELQQRMLIEWDTRLEVLPRLRYWTQRVMGEPAKPALQDEDDDDMDDHVTWEICVGCACYKIETDDWQEGWDFYDVLDENVTFADWVGIKWSILHDRIEEGSFCKSCCQEWENLRVSWDVGVCAS